MTERELLFALLGRAYNVPNEQITSLLYQKDGEGKEIVSSTALNGLLQLDADRVARLKPADDLFNNGYKKGHLEVSDRWEKTLREKFNVDPEGVLKGDALADAIKAAVSAASANPEDVKRNPVYLDLETRTRKEREELTSQRDAEIKKIQEAWNRDKLWTKASASIPTVVTALENINHEVVTPGMLELFAERYSSYDLQPTADGDYLLFRDGKRVEDAHSNPVTLKAAVTADAVRYLPARAQAAGGNGGNTNQPAGSGTVNTTFKDDNDFLTQYNAIPDGDPKKEALAAAYELQTSKG